jgi:mannose-6-phosphate isomerase-like protein (cupin superfamily)
MQSISDIFFERRNNSMVRKSEEKDVARKPAPFEGKGEITVRNLLNGDAEMNSKGRVFAHTTVYPHSAIGYHVHNGDAEIYYILRGEAIYDDNGTMTTLHPGDVTITPAGQGHGIECAGDEPIEMIALILYE